jgi:5-methylthioadenosine/S-adenosylhomocysteine deaminase
MAAHYGVKVSHNAASNMYLSSGVAPVPAMIAQGICVGLGVDGAASNNSQDMLELMKLTALLHKVSSRDPTVITAEKVLEMATIDGARCLGMEEEIGSIEPGKRADLVVFDPKRSPKAIPLHNPVSTIVYSSSEKNIDTVMVDGVTLIEGGAYRGAASEAAILEACQEAAEDLARSGGMANRMAAHPWRSTAF